MLSAEGSVPPLFDTSTGCFDGPRLHLAILARGYTRREFARTCRLNPSLVHKACKGRRVSDATAIAIFEGLEKRQPMAVAS